MNYDIGRSLAVRNGYALTIKEFVKRYRLKKPTVVLLAGGMGSQLDRSPAPYQGEPIDLSNYHTVWMDPGLFFEGDTLKLEIDDQGQDKDGHIIVPNGPLRFLVNAYDGTKRYFDDQKYNYVEFGYDWRRPIEEAAGYLEMFLNLMRNSVFEHHREDPLPNVTLLCHSQGGLVAKVFLHRIVDVSNWLRYVITVGTPFYGTSTHMRRYFIGQPPLNTLHGKKVVARVASTMPGPYTLMFIDKDTYDRDGQALGLQKYPIFDADNEEPTDPYDQRMFDRYPGWVNRDFIAQARQIRQTISYTLPEPVSQKMYHVRSALDTDTPTMLKWSQLPDGFDPDKFDQSPVTPADTTGGGDGTVPAWSARLAQTDNERIHDLEKAKVHSYLLEHEETLEVVTSVIESGRLPDTITAKDELFGSPIERRSPEELNQFLQDIKESRTGRDDPRAYDEGIWKGIFEEIKQ